MKKNYIAPQIEDVVLEGLMAEATFLGVATVSTGDPATVTGAQGA